MRLTLRDASATILVAAIVAAYAGYLAWGAVPLIGGARDMAVVGLILGFAACATGGSLVAGSRSSGGTFLGLLSLISLAFGVVAAITQSETMLAAFIATLVALWLLATLRHLGGQGAVRHVPS